MGDDEEEDTDSEFSSSMYFLTSLTSKCYHEHHLYPLLFHVLELYHIINGLYQQLSCYVFVIYNEKDGQYSYVTK